MNLKDLLLVINYHEEIVIREYLESKLLFESRVDKLDLSVIKYYDYKVIRIDCMDEKNIYYDNTIR